MGINVPAELLLIYNAQYKVVAEACKTCKGEGGTERARSSTSYAWSFCTDCYGNKDKNKVTIELTLPSLKQLIDSIPPQEKLVRRMYKVDLRNGNKEVVSTNVPVSVLEYIKSMNELNRFGYGHEAMYLPLDAEYDKLVEYKW